MLRWHKQSVAVCSAISIFWLSWPRVCGEEQRRKHSAAASSCQWGQVGIVTLSVSDCLEAGVEECVWVCLVHFHHCFCQGILELGERKKKLYIATYWHENTSSSEQLNFLNWLLNGETQVYVWSSAGQFLSMVGNSEPPLSCRSCGK